jgi:hypothetical protein
MMQDLFSTSLAWGISQVRGNVLVQSARQIGMGAVLLLPALTQLLLTPPASAVSDTNREAVILADVQQGSPPTGSSSPQHFTVFEQVRPQTRRSATGRSATRSEQLLTIATPDLPLLRDSSLFLPEVDPLADVHLVLKLSDRRVYVYDKDQVKTSFPVAIGRNGWETPTGKFKVTRMQQNPIWQHPFTGALIPPGAGNPLGTRWIGFWTDGKNQIGFHGTPNEETVGRPASHGCVRMYNRDVVRLFTMVEVGTPVEVVP